MDIRILGNGYWLQRSFLRFFPQLAYSWSFDATKRCRLINKVSIMPITGYDYQLYPFQSKWMEIEDHLIHYIDEGRGEVLLFCHPPVSSSFMYRNMIPALSKQFRCIALDFPGFGLSVSANGNVPSIQSEGVIIEKLLMKLEIQSVFFV